MEPALRSRTAFPYTRPQDPPQAQAQARPASHSPGPAGLTASSHPTNDGLHGTHLAESPPPDRHSTAGPSLPCGWRRMLLRPRRAPRRPAQPSALRLRAALPRFLAGAFLEARRARAVRGSGCPRQCLNNHGPTAALPRAESFHKIPPTRQSVLNRNSVVIPLFQAERRRCEPSGTARAAPLGLRAVAAAG